MVFCFSCQNHPGTVSLPWQLAPLCRFYPHTSIPVSFCPSEQRAPADRHLLLNSLGTECPLNSWSSRTRHTAPTRQKSGTQLCEPLLFLWALEEPPEVRARQASQRSGSPSTGFPLRCEYQLVSAFSSCLGARIPGLKHRNLSLYIPRVGILASFCCFLFFVFFSAILSVLVPFQFFKYIVATIFTLHFLC